MSLHLDYRPRNLDEIIGNKDTVLKLEKQVLNPDGPHVYLLSGSRGCGKTTLARIATEMIGCDERDIQEIDVANNRGKDDATRLKEGIRFLPMFGKVKAYILDECFSSNTKVKTIIGSKEIKDIKVGEKLYNIQGETEVEKVFINKVDLNRVVKLRFKNQDPIYCSKDHLFLTSEGWEKAINLNKKSLLLKYDCTIMESITLQSEIKKDENSKTNLFKLRKDVSTNGNCSKLLFNIMQRIYEIQEDLRILWDRIFIKEQKRSFLLPELCWEVEKLTTGNKRENVYGRMAKQLQNSKAESYKKESRKISRIIQTIFRTNEEKQPLKKPFNYSKGERDKTNKWNFAYLEREAGRKRTTYRTSNIISLFSWLGYGICYWIGEKATRISNLLQSRYRKSIFKTSNRSGREWTQYEKEYSKRFKKDKKIKRTWLESVEIYEPGNNDKSFSRIITDKERNKNYVNFYDLQIKGHPSYFVGELAVHNCHQGTPAYFNALLKTLEDTPKHVYFFLCTTDPQKLLTTVKSRCSPYKVNPLTQKEVINLLNWVLENEEKELEKEELKRISEVCEGIPREALIILDQIIDLKPEDRLRAIEATKQLSLIHI